MAVKVGINGFGRIGRMVGRAILEKNSKNFDIQMKAVFEIELRAQSAALQAARPGVACQAVDAAARKVIEDGRPLRGVVHDPLARLQGGVSGNAGLFSTADDLAVFSQMMLEGGEYRGARILSPKTVELMTANHVGTLYNEGAMGFGFGFEVIEHLGRSGKPGGSVGAYGWGSAYFPQYVVDPKERMVVLLMTQLRPTLTSSEHSSTCLPSYMARARMRSLNKGSDFRRSSKRAPRLKSPKTTSAMKTCTQESMAIRLRRGT